MNFESILSGERFQQLCDVYCGSFYDLYRNPVIARQTEKHMYIDQLNKEWNNPSLIFCYSCALSTFQSKLHLLKNPFVLVSHNEDTNITEMEYQGILTCPLVIKWFAQNKMIEHPKVELLPIGVANAMWTHGNVNTLLQVAQSNLPKNNTLYFYFNTSTNAKERESCKVTLEAKGLQFGSLKSHSAYLQELASSKFAICPPGNGIDCHRTWECFYLNVIPVLLKSAFTESLSHVLPCILLTSWDEFDYSLLTDATYNELIQKLNKAKLHLSLDYYKSQIYKYIPKSYSHVDNKNSPLDYKLNALFNKENGFFIELGANNGLIQSNTAFFEFYKGWKGILVEPSKNAYEECVKHRPNSICYNFACVDNDYTSDEIVGDFNGNLMSSVHGSRLQSNSLVSVKTTTLEKILDASKIQQIDFLSLDTEGFELTVLKGLNLNKYRPKYMLIEIYNKDYDAIVSFLQENRYSLMCNFSNYNVIDNPHWDMTHNDYLFCDVMI